MNIQQLNESGQHIRVFLITAAAALFLTFLIWRCVAIHFRFERFQVERRYHKRKGVARLLQVLFIWLIMFMGGGRWL